MDGILGIDTSYHRKMDQDCARAMYLMEESIKYIQDAIEKLESYNGKYLVNSYITMLSSHEKTIGLDRDAVENLKEYYKAYYENMVEADSLCFDYIKTSYYTTDNYGIKYEQSGTGFKFEPLSFDPDNELNKDKSDMDILNDFYEYIKEVQGVAAYSDKKDQTTLAYKLLLAIKSKGIDQDVQKLIIDNALTVDPNTNVDELKKLLNTEWGDINDIQVKADKLGKIFKYLDTGISAVNGFNDAMNDGNNPYAGAAVKGGIAYATDGITLTLTFKGAEVGGSIGGPWGALIGGGIGLVGGILIDSEITEVLDNVGDWYLDTFHSSSVYENKAPMHIHGIRFV